MNKRENLSNALDLLNETEDLLSAMKLLLENDHRDDICHYKTMTSVINNKISLCKVIVLKEYQEINGRL